MATKRKVADEPQTDFSGVAKVIENAPLQDYMEKTFLAYAYTTIVDRSLFDARDGLKPVHRRILWSMFDNGLMPTRAHVKSAKVVGDVMGNLHPHGDSSIYEAAVRLVQPFSLSVPLVDGHGNFGTAPGDKAAASRYSEIRLSHASLALLEGINEGAIDFEPNFDGTYKQPTVLPAGFPNLVVNGGSGIATGMACNLAPHNPDEVIDATRYLLNHPTATLDKLMEYLPGPDLPTGGSIIGMDGVKEAYETGRGKFRIRATYHVEDMGRGKSRIVYTEMPYEISIEKVIEEIKKKINEGKLIGIADAKDLTDRRNGTRFVVESKPGINANALVSELFASTPLEVTFAINNTVIINDTPKTVGIKELLEVFISHRKEVVRRRTEFRKQKHTDRLHIVEGIIKALADIDKAIAIIRKAEDVEVAQAQLIKTFKVDEIQADYILNLQLRRLTRFNQIELNEEKASLVEEVRKLDEILNSEETLRKVISDELLAVKKAISMPRRSILVGGNLAEHLEEAKAAANASLQIEDVTNTLAVYASGSLTRTADAPVVSARGKIDPIVSTLLTSARASFLAITNTGRAQRVEVIHVGENSKVTPANAGITLKKGERIIAFAPNALEGNENGALIIGTKKGIVKGVKNDWHNVRTDEFPVITLAEGDEILSARWIANGDDIHYAFLTTDAILQFKNNVRSQGRLGSGIAGISLSSGKEAISFAALTSEEASKAEFFVVVADTAGKPVAMKRSLLETVPLKGRATAGQRQVRLLKGQSGVIGGAILRTPLILNQAGKLVQRGDIAGRDASATLFSEPVESISFGESQ